MLGRKPKTDEQRRLAAFSESQTKTILGYGEAEAEQRQRDKFQREAISAFLKNIVATQTKYVTKDNGEWMSKASIDELLIAAKEVYHDDKTKANEIINRLAEAMEAAGYREQGHVEQIAALKKENHALRSQSGGKQTYTLPPPNKNSAQKKQSDVDNGKPSQSNKSGGTEKPPKIEVQSTEEDDALLAALDEEGDNAVRNAVKMKPTPSSIPISRSQKRQKSAADARSNAAIGQYGVVLFEDIMKQISDAGWSILSVMAESGKSLYSEILTAVMAKNPMLSKTMIGAQLTTLKNCGVVDATKISTPFRRNFQVCWITEDIGRKVYEIKYPGRSIKKAEASKILSEHSSFDHGYAIIEIADMISKQECVQSVDAYNRKNPIPIDNGISYIPDIKVIDENGAVSYIEYECGTTPQRDFNAKCSKMLRVTSVLNIIGKNRDTAEHLRQQVDSWIKAKTVSSLRGAVIRIVAATNMSETDFRDNKGWKYVYTIDGTPESATPVQNF